MPRRFKSRRYRKKNNYIRRTVGKNKAKIKRIADMIEYKHLDITSTSTPTWTDSAPIQLNAIDQGLTKITRIGDEIHMNRIMIRGYINNNRGTPTDGIARIILYRKLAPQGQTLTRGDLLLNLAGGTTINTGMNIQTNGQYKVYFDQTVGYDTTGKSYIPFKIIQKLSSVARYNGAGVTVGDMELNGLYLLCLGTNVANDAHTPHVVFESRMSFTDS